MRRTVWFLLVLSVVAACSRSAADPSGTPDLPTMSVEAFEARLAALERPAVVNVWASWCIPCRSEAPLLKTAFESYAPEVEFIGVAVQDSQPGAKAFLAEFGLEFDQVFDRNRSIPNRFAGIGTPITFFFAPGGELVRTHNGIIDERALVLGIDEILHTST